MATLNLSDIWPLTAEELQSFEDRLLPAWGGCHLWIGARQSAGYGFAWFRGHGVLAHRLAWVIHNQKSLPKGAHVLHRCDVKPCCNGEHLMAGSNLDNHLDKASKGRGPKSQKGMPYGVQPSGKKFRADAQLGGSHHHLGCFDTAEEAGQVAMDYKIAYLAEAGLTYQETQ